MQKPTTRDFDMQLVAARQGLEPALDELFRRYRSLLKMLVDAHLQGPFRAKADSSDIVQETFLQAAKNLDGFRGETESAFIAWLRSILDCQLSSFYRYHYATKRSINTEERLDAHWEQSSAMLDRALCVTSSPSARVAAEERLIALSDAIESLPDHYRTVIVLRHVRGDSFSDIAATMNRSVDSVKKLWTRALAKLRHMMGDNDV